MRSHPAYHCRNQFCRMQNPRFRSVYIDPIPYDALLPYSIDLLRRIDYRSNRREAS